MDTAGEKWHGYSYQKGWRDLGPTIIKWMWPRASGRGQQWVTPDPEGTMIPAFHKNHHTSPFTLNLGSCVSLCSILAIIICFFLILILFLLTVYLLLYFLLLSQIFEDLTVDEWWKKEAFWLKIYKVGKQEQSWGYEGLWHLPHVHSICSEVDLSWKVAQELNLLGLFLSVVIFKDRKISIFQYLAF